MRPAKIIFFTIIASTLLVFMLSVGAFAMSIATIAIADFAGIEPNHGVRVFGGLVLFLGIVRLVPRDKLALNRKFCIEGEVIIDAPIEDVWNRVNLRERSDYFNPVIRQVRAVPGAPQEFKLLFKKGMACALAACPDSLRVRLLDEEIYEYMAFHAVNAKQMPLFGKDHRMTEILLEQQLDGVRVRYIETLSRITLGTLLALIFLNPARDTLRSLKAQIEKEASAQTKSDNLGGLRSSYETGTVETGRQMSAMRLLGGSTVVASAAIVMFLTFP